MKKLFVPTVLALIGFCILIALGTWQMRRHYWKQDIIAQIKAGISSQPISYQDWLSKPEGSKPSQFSHVKIKGHFLKDQEVYVYALQKPSLGFWVFTPLQFSQNQFIFVNRGFVPEGLKSSLKFNEPSQEREISGLIRLPEKPGTFSPVPDTKNRTWYIKDIESMKQQLGTEKLQNQHYIEAINIAKSGKWPRPRPPKTILTALPNRHLEYALTWYGLSVALLAVFSLFLRASLRPDGRESR